MLTILVYILFKMGMLAGMSLASVKTIITVTLIVDLIAWIVNN